MSELLDMVLKAHGGLDLWCCRIAGGLWRN
jgi:hypothetical protein